MRTAPDQHTYIETIERLNAARDERRKTFFSLYDQMHSEGTDPAELADLERHYGISPEDWQWYDMQCQEKQAEFDRAVGYEPQELVQIERAKFHGLEVI